MLCLRLTTTLAAAAGLSLTTAGAAVDCDPPLECPPGSLQENEPSNGGCEDEYADEWNSGCNSDANPNGAFNSPDLSCGDTICGRSGTFLVEDPDNPGEFLNYRDTDWFLLTLPADQSLTWSAVGEFETLIFIVDVPGGTCGDDETLGSNSGPACEEVSMTMNLGPGTYSLLVMPAVFEGVGCGVDWVATVTCTEPMAACCLPDGSCVVSLESDCNAQDGFWTEDEVTCNFVNCPTNSGCEFAMPIGDVNGLCYDASLATDSQLGTCLFGGEDLFYCYTAAEAGTVSVEVVNESETDGAAIAVYEGCGCNGELGDELVCESELNFDDLIFDFEAAAGQSYLIQLGGEQALRHPFGTLSIYQGVMPPPLGACCVDGACVATESEEDCLARPEEPVWFEGECCGFGGFVCPSTADVLIATVIVGTFTDNSDLWQQAFSNAGLTADVIVDPQDAGWPDLSQHQAVVVLTNDTWWDESQGNNFGADDQDVLAAFADNGGILIIIGQDYIFSIGEDITLPFLQAQFGVTGVVQDVNFGDETEMTITGLAGGPFEGFNSADDCCWEANCWFTDDLTANQEILEWETVDFPGDFTGAAISDRGIFSVVEFACFDSIPFAFQDYVDAIIERFELGGGPELCPEDIDGNDVVNVFDLLQLLGAWGPCPGCPEDLDGNDVVNVFDLLQLLGAWGPCPVS
jgi:hypothetical protein